MSFFLVWLFLSVEKIAAILMAPLSLIFSGFGLAVLCITALVIIFSFIFGSEHHDDLQIVRDFWIKVSKLLFGKKSIIFVITPIFLMGIAGKMLPSQKELAIILAAGGAYEILTTDPAKEMGNKALTILNQELDKILKENQEILEGPIDSGKEMLENSPNVEKKGVI